MSEKKAADGIWEQLPSSLTLILLTVLAAGASFLVAEHVVHWLQYLGFVGLFILSAALHPFMRDPNGHESLDDDKNARDERRMTREEEAN